MEEYMKFFKLILIALTLGFVTQYAAAETVGIGTTETNVSRFSTNNTIQCENVILSYSIVYISIEHNQVFVLSVLSLYRN